MPTAPKPDGLSRIRRILLSALLALSLGFIGLAVGTTLGGWLFVPPGSGFAGPVIALGYGVLAALVLISVGVVTVWQARPQKLRLMAYSAAILAVLVLLAFIMLVQLRGAGAPIVQDTLTHTTKPVAPSS